MKTFLRVLFFAVLLLGRAAFAATPGAYDIEVRQRNSINTLWEQKFITGSSGKLFGFTTGGAPSAITLGTGLSYDSGTNTLNGTGGATGLAVDTIAALRALSVSGRTTGDLLTLRGYYATNDGGQGTFVYNSSSTTGDDDGLVIQPTSGSGRWFRLHTGVVHTKWFGAKGDGTTNDSITLANALNRPFASGAAYGTEGYARAISTVIFDPGVYSADSLSINNVQNLKIIGSKATIRARNSVSYILRIGNDTGTPENVEIEGLRLDGNNLTQNGLLIREGVFMAIRNVSAVNNTASNFKVDGSDFRGVFSILFDTCTASGTGNGFYFFQNGNTSAFTHLTLLNCTVEGASYGINSNGTQSITVVGGVYENCTSACVYVNGGKATLIGTFLENGNSVSDIATVNGEVIPINSNYSDAALSKTGTGGILLKHVGRIAADTSGSELGEVIAGEYGASGGRMIRMGNSRTLDYLDTMLSHNLLPVYGANTYQTHRTGSYAAMEFYYDGSTARGVRWYTSTSNGTAGSPMSLTPKMTLDSGGNLTVVGNITGANVSGTIGNVTASGTLTGNSTEGNIIIGNGGTTVRAAGITYNTTTDTLTVNSISTNTIAANSVMVNNVMTGNVGGTGADNGSRVITYGGNVTFNGSFTTQFNISANTALTLPTSGTLTTLSVVKTALPVTIPLTIDLVADGHNYGKTFIPANFTVSKIVAVHVANGGALSSPSIVATIKHGTDRTSGTTIEAVTVTSSTTGTVVTSSIDDATIPADSFVWVETGSKSGTTGNLEVYLVGTYD